MKNILIYGLMICAGLLMPVWGQSAGTASFEFLRSQYSPRGAAMGGNLTAIKNDVQSLNYNPAAMAGSETVQWNISYVDHLIDFQGGQLVYSLPHKKFGNLNAGLIYFNYGSFDETDEFGDRTGRTFSAAEFAFSLGVGNHLGKGFDYGIGLKYIYSSIEDYNASAVALDAGLLYTAAALDNAQFGISLLHFGRTLDNYTGVREKLPLLLRIGFAKRLTHLPLLLAASLNDITMSENKLSDRFKKFAIGGEFEISESIRLRLGYQNEVHRSVKPLGRNLFGGVAIGLGVFWRTFRFDYSYSNFGDLGSQNRLGITGTL